MLLFAYVRTFNWIRLIYFAILLLKLINIKIVSPLLFL